MKTKYLLPVAMILLFIAVKLSSCKNGDGKVKVNISGAVKDSDGKDLDDVTILVYSVSGEERGGAVDSAEVNTKGGKFEVKGISKGDKYVVNVIKEKYA